MTCYTPNLTDALSDLSCSTNRNRRSVEEHEYANFTIELGFKFDGLKDYLRANALFNMTDQLYISSAPHITAATIIKSTQAVKITGSYLSSCCDKNDYTVTVDNSSCNILSLYETEIRCTLDNQWDSSAVDSEFQVAVS